MFLVSCEGERAQIRLGLCPDWQEVHVDPAAEFCNGRAIIVTRRGDVESLCETFHRAGRVVKAPTNAATTLAKVEFMKTNGKLRFRLLRLYQGDLLLQNVEDDTFYAAEAVVDDLCQIMAK